VRPEVHVAAASIRDVRIPLRRPEVRVSEHLLHGSQIGASFEEVRRERMAQKMRVDAARLQTGSFGELAEDEKRTGARERAAAGVEEELGAVAAIEVRAPECEIPPDGLGSRSPEGHEALLATLPEHAHDPLLDGDAALLEPHGLGDSQAGPVEELHERAIAERAWRRADCGVDESLRLGR
jgi:hypothetical protein